MDILMNSFVKKTRKEGYECSDDALTTFILITLWNQKMKNIKYANALLNT